LNCQILESHAWYREFENHQFDEKYTGSITFDEPSEVNALQAADMIAWSNLRKQIRGGDIGKGFEPLDRLTRTVHFDKYSTAHYNFPVKKNGTKALEEIVSQGIPVPKKIGKLELAKLFFTSTKRIKK